MIPLRATFNLGMRQWRSRRWIVLAPHPDDETLGTGALIAQTAGTGCLARLVYLTDGSSSHPSAGGKSAKLIGTRKREAGLALRRLATRHSDLPMFLNWRDAHPVEKGDPLFERSCRALAALCIRLRVDVLATTASQEPHCDHAAAATLARAVQIAVKRPLALAEYIVWGQAPSRRTHHAIATHPMLPGVRRHALAAHRSQLTPSHGVGFRLPREKRSMSRRDILYIRKS